MPSAYEQLLDATIQHLESLKARGVRHLPVSPETLRALAGEAAPVNQAHAALPPKPVTVPDARPMPAATPTRPAPRAAVAPATSVPPASPPLPRPGPTPSQSLKRAPDVVPPETTLSLELPGVAESPAAAPPLSPEAKAAAFAALRERAMQCVKCPHLAATRKNVVFGVGNINAQLMFIGEAPGADEDEQGEPFVGKAGQLLTKIIEAMGLRRSDVYIGNVLKCRPDTPGQPTGNRKPTADEMKTCLPYLQEQIDLIRPRVLVALGGTAMEGLLGKSGITRLRGHWHSYRGIPLMPTYHPAYLLRNQSLAEKRKVWEDMLQVMEKLGLPISDKQRRYFLKPER
ncbi:MAG: uracil-DNA glycosylase [Verrucomicrobiae bacterium]|nr:uracil-DNA glycosylase [Verrucomicrobiae bacterium]